MHIAMNNWIYIIGFGGGHNLYISGKINCGGNGLRKPIICLVPPKSAF